MNKMKSIENELIPIYETSKGSKVINARELHDFLNVSRDFSTWITQRIEEYGFQEEIDFSTFLGESNGGRPPKEYICTLDMGKELGMVERNSKGRQIRQYFIEVEKEFNAPVNNKRTPKSELQVLRMAIDQIEVAQKEAREAKQIAQDIKDTIIHADEDWKNWVNDQFSKLGFKTGNYRELRKQSYDILENRAHCRLSVRLSNLKDRLREAGATKTKISQTNNLDVIEEDPRLKEIYSAIVERIVIKYSA